MYNHGSKQLDMVYLSSSLHKVACGYLHCHDTIIYADHSALWLDVPLALLYLQAPPSHLAKGWWLKTDSPKVCVNYLHWYKMVCCKHNLFEHARVLWKSVQDGTPLTLEQMMEFENSNALCTKRMNDAEKHCRKMKMGAIEWSPNLALAWDRIAAWTALLRTQKGIKINSRLVQRLVKKTNLSLSWGLLVDTIANNLKAAYKDYSALKKQASSL